MISYRHHIVSLVAVFLALAVGVVLGGGPLSDLERDDRATLSKSPAATRTERTPDFGDQFAAASAARLYAGGLADKRVAVVTMPGAEPDTTTARSSRRVVSIRCTRAHSAAR